MRQVTQRLRDGRISVVEVPTPAVTPDGVLVDVRASLLSAGTERSKVQTGKQSLVGKARARPDQVRQVLEKAQRDGLRETVRAVRSRLEQPSTLGYSCAGVVLAVGERVSDIAPGDRVACGGADYAVHAEIVHVPVNLCVRLPDDVDFATGAFATVGSIALHGVRQADVRLGERVAVIGLGLVGQLTGQLLRAAGCQVIGVDISRELCERALEDGAADRVFQRSELGEAEPPAEAGECDAVVVTAAARSTDPVETAARLCRDRARVVIVGDVQMELPRSTYYGKELDLRLSRSYGPGRYDKEYEERGLDYPVGYVRWTERRNMAAFVELAGKGRIATAPLITQRVPLERAPEAYERLLSDESSPLGILLEYAESTTATQTEPAAAAPRITAAPRNRLSVGVIGAGSFAQGTVMPGLAGAGFELTSVASATGRSAVGARDQFGFRRAETVDELLAADDVGAVAIVSRHATHADLAVRALEQGKAVFVEKPPCLDEEELERLRAARRDSGLPLLVGFNRRFAPQADALRQHIRARGRPFQLLFRVNAGLLPPDHWLNDPNDGGGRLLGEGCHFVDFACWFAGAMPERVACMMRAPSGEPLAAAQSFTVSLGFAGGGLATVLYASDGSKRFNKEYVEAHSNGRSGSIDDFKQIVLGNGRSGNDSARRRDKGHERQFSHFREVVEGRSELSEPDPLDSMAVTLAALRSAQTGVEVSLAEASA